MSINNKVDFMLTVQVENANPNGDPLYGNKPRTDSRGYGEISDVCIKRKIRNRLQDMDENIFVQSNDRLQDGFNSLEERFNSEFENKDPDEEVYKKSCELWIDVRSFGQVISFGKNENNKGRSIGIRGPVSINIAKSLSPIEIKTMQITRSTNGVMPKGGSSRSSDTMGTKNMVEHGVYLIKGSINAYLSDKTGFCEDDKEKIKESLRTLFVNDVSSARPDGSMEVKEVFWFEHASKIGDVSSAKVHNLLEFDELELKYDDNRALLEKPEYSDYNIRLNEEKLDEYKKLGLEVEIIEGI